MTFPALREDVEKSAAVIKAASERKASREEVCPLFKSFAAKEAKMVAFLETNQKLCGVPPKIITQVKTNHASTIRIRNTVCSAGPAGPARRADAERCARRADHRRRHIRQAARPRHLRHADGQRPAKMSQSCRTRRRCDRKLGGPERAGSGRVPISG